MSVITTTESSTPPGNDNSFSIAQALGGLSADIRNMRDLVSTSIDTAKSHDERIRGVEQGIAALIEGQKPTVGLAERLDKIEGIVTSDHADIAILKVNAPTRLTWPIILGGGASVAALIGLANVIGDAFSKTL